MCRKASEENLHYLPLSKVSNMLIGFIHKCIPWKIPQTKTIQYTSNLQKCPNNFPKSENICLKDLPETPPKIKTAKSFY